MRPNSSHILVILFYPFVTTLITNYVRYVMVYDVECVSPPWVEIASITRCGLNCRCLCHRSTPCPGIPSDVRSTFLPSMLGCFVEHGQRSEPLDPSSVLFQVPPSCPQLLCFHVFVSSNAFVVTLLHC
jgi:hypothetical protein